MKNGVKIFKNFSNNCNSPKKTPEGVFLGSGTGHSEEKKDETKIWKAEDETGGGIRGRHWYGNSETKGNNDENWKRINGETGKKEIENFTVESNFLKWATKNGPIDFEYRFRFFQ